MTIQSQADLEQELAVTKAELAKAQEILRATRAGEVDAFVLSTDDGEGVYTLKSADHPYRVFFEQMSEGACTLETDGTILNCNACFAKILGRPLNELLGQSLLPLMSESDAGRVASRLRQADEDTQRWETEFIRPDGQRVPVRLSCSPHTAAQEDQRCLVASDLSVVKRAMAIEQRGELLAAANRMLHESMYCPTVEEAARVCLSVAEELTGAAFGFVGELNKTGRLDTIAISDPGWEACRMPEGNAVRAILDMEVRGIWGDVIRREQPQIVNDPANHPERVGIPAEHPPLHSFLGVPLRRGGETIGILALANKEGGFVPHDQEAIESLALVFVEALHRKRTEVELTRHREDLEGLVGQRTTELRRANESLRREVTKRARIQDELDAQVGQLRTLFDGIEEIIYVCDPATHELLYVNETCRRHWGGQLLGKKCFRVLQGRDEPCPFCTNDRLFGENFGKCYVWEFQNEVTRHWYRCSDKGIRWADGRLVRFELASDITDSKRAELALAEREQQLRVTLASIGDGVIATDTQRRVVRVNHAAEVLTGWTEADARGQLLDDVFKVVNEHSREAVDDPVGKALESDEIVGLANHSVLIAKDGAEYAIADSAAPIRAESGKTIGAVLVFRDVSAEREQQREKDRLLHDLGERVKELSCLFKLSAIIETPDISLEQLLAAAVEILPPAWQYPSETAARIRVDGQVYVTPGFREDVPRLRELLTVDGEPNGDVDVCYFGANEAGADDVFLDEERTLLTVFAERLTHVIGRRQAEEELRKTLEQTRFFFERQVVGMAITSPEKGWLRVNDMMCEMLRYTREELLEMTWAELTHPDDIEQDVRQFERVLQGHLDGYMLEKRFICKGGGVLHAHLSVGCVRQPDGSVDYVLAAVTDLSEVKRAQSVAEEKATELARSNTELEKFAYVASHDLKAPLRAIDNLSQWIEEDLADALTGESRENMGLLRGRVHRLESLLDDLLAYSRAGRKGTECVHVCIKDLVEGIVSELDIPPGLAINVTADVPECETPRGPLEQIFRNLIGNAVKHHDRAEGTISVCVEDVGAHYEISVSDDGPGIPPDLQEKAFEMFQTLRPRDEVEGSGIGLAVVRKLVEWQGGRITIDSPADQRGTTFRFAWKKHWQMPEE